MSKRKYKPLKTSEIIISEIIGLRPKKPASYNIRRMDKNNKKNQDFCDAYDKKLAEWQEKANKIRNENKIEYPDFIEKPKPNIKLTSEQIIEDFKKAFKVVNKKEFQESNKYSDTNEPEELMKLLVYYFNKDKRFFESKLINKDLSIPSFDKGLLLIGKYGCGKSSAFKTINFLFNHYVKVTNKKMPGNQQELLDKFRINQVIATELVLDYKQSLMNHKKPIEEILRKTKSRIQLYIDDLLKEEILFKSKDNEVNIFKDILTLRDENHYKTHISLNLKEVAGAKKSYFEDTETSLRELIYKYNGTVHDRVFGSYNIIELNGKSMRR